MIIAIAHSASSQTCFRCRAGCNLSEPAAVRAERTTDDTQVVRGWRWYARERSRQHRNESGTFYPLSKARAIPSQVVFAFPAVAAMEVPASAPRSCRRTAAGRRAQRKRAEGRVAMRLMACFRKVLRHCGGQLTMLEGALSQALKELEAPAPVSRSDAAERAPASYAGAVECVMQVDEATGLDAQLALSADVAGCDEDLFEEAREELLSESLWEGTVERIVVSRSGGS